jgi:transposase InsO family protein
MTMLVNAGFSRLATSVGRSNQGVSRQLLRLLRPVPVVLLGIPGASPPTAGCDRPKCEGSRASRTVRACSIGCEAPGCAWFGIVPDPLVGGVGRQNLRRPQIGDADAVLELFRLLFATAQAAARPHQNLVVENLLLRHQLAVLTRPTRSRPQARLRLWDRLLWILARRFCAGWRQHLYFVTPDTVVRWHRQGWRMLWRWKSRSRGGRPHLSSELRNLIATMSRDNRLWGTERIRGELLKLGILVSSRSIRRYRWRGPARSPSQTWRTFLRNHAHHLWAADLLTVRTLTFKTLYVLVFIAHRRRELVHVNVTANPTAAWVWRQLIEATPWGHKPRHLLRDRDAVYGSDFRKRALRIGIDAIATPIHAPKANAVVERVIGTLRRECLDHLIVLDEQHLRIVLTEYVQYYNQERPHRTLELQTPQLQGRPTAGIVRSRPVLNGLHHVYERAA